MLATDLALLTEAARAAGDIAIRHFHDGHVVWDKGPGLGPVTEADLEVNAMLLDLLSGARPDYGWLSEESEDDATRLGCQRVFVVDPIDGTRAFIEGHRTWAHSLAVVDAGTPVAGVVYLPLLDKLYTAIVGNGARLNGQPIAAPERTRLDGANLLAGRPVFDPHHWPGGVPRVARHFRSSLAYRMCLVGEGCFDGMLTLRPSWEWDLAAGTLIAAEAGAIVTDRFGQPLRFNGPARQTPGVICTAAGIHTEVVNRLSHAAGDGAPGR